MPDEQRPTFGKGMAPGDRPYEWLQPADHTGVCWAAAIGRAMRGRLTSDHGEVAARRAAAMLADGSKDCICGPRKRRKRPTRR